MWVAWIMILAPCLCMVSASLDRPSIVSSRERLTGLHRLLGLSRETGLEPPQILEADAALGLFLVVADVALAGHAVVGVDLGVRGADDAVADLDWFELDGFERVRVAHGRAAWSGGVRGGGAARGRVSARSSVTVNTQCAWPSAAHRVSSLWVFQVWPVAWPTQSIAPENQPANR